MESTLPRVFLSSRIDEKMKVLREGLKKSCARADINLKYADQETGAKDASPHNLSTDLAVSCQIFVLLIGEDGIGPITQAEWRAWRAKGRLESGCKELVFYTKQLGDQRAREIFADTFSGGSLDESTWSEIDMLEDPDSALLDIAMDIGRTVREFDLANYIASDPFPQEIHDYYQAKGAITERIAPVVPGQAWFIASTKDKRELVYCCKDKIGPDDVRAVDQLAIERNATHFLLVTEEAFPATLRDVKTITPRENRRLRLVNSFLLEMLDIADDIKKIEDMAKGDDLADRFVDPGCKECVAQESWDEFQYIPHESALEYVTSWLDKPSREQLAVLGDFGTGKSWLARRICLNLCKNIREREKGRLPLFVPFKSIQFAPQDETGAGQTKETRKLQLMEHIAGLISDEHSANPLLRILLRSGRLLLVLDGFDELGSGMDDRDKESHLADISELTKDDSKLKIILTSRREFFDSAMSEGKVLAKVGRRDLSLRFEIMKLTEFRPHHIQRHLRKALNDDHQADRYYARIKDTPGLETLVGRPVVLDMVLAILRSEKSTGTLSLFEIYSHCTSHWLDGIAKDDAELDGELRLALTSDLAWHMYKKGWDEVARDKLAEMISSIRQFGDWLKDMDRLLRLKINPSARTETFLVRNGEGGYAFAHRSYMEYFVARKLLSEMGAGRPELLGEKHVSDGVAAFLLAHGVDTALLQGWLRDSDSGEWLAGNILTLLKGSNVDLRGIDLSGLVIKKANLRRTPLQGVSFRGAKLDGVVLAGADLSDADCRDALLKDLNLGVKSSAKTISCSPTSNLVASANRDNEIILIDLDSDAEPFVLGAHKDSITCVRFSEDGKRLASVGFDKQLIVWDVERRQPLQTFQTETSSPYATAIMDDYDVVMAAGLDTKVYAWALADRRDLGSRKAHAKTVYCIATCVTRDSQDDWERGLFATASFDETVTVWNLTSPSVGFRVPEVVTLKAHQDLVNGVAFTPDGEQIVSADNLGKLVVHRYIDDSWEFDVEISAHDTQIWCVQVSPDGKLAATSSTDGAIAVWSTSDWTEKMRLPGHDSAAWGVDFDASSTRLVSCSLDATIRVWDLDKQTQTRSIFVGKLRDPGFTCNGMKIGGSRGLSALQSMLLLELGADDTVKEN